MAHFIPGPHHVKHPMNQTNIMLQPGGFRAVTGGPSIFGNGYCYGGNYGNYGGYGYGGYGCCNADDGKLTFGQKVGSFFKGIGNTIKGAVKNLFTPKGLLTTALCVGACFIPGVGPFIAAGLACIGIAKGAGTVIKGAQQASQATTDAEAMAAWENIGGGTFTVAASAVALKGSVGAIKANTASAGLSTTKGMTATQKLSTHWKGATKTFKSSNFGKTITGKIKSGTTKVQNAYNKIKSSNIKDTVKNSWDDAAQQTKSYQNYTDAQARLAKWEKFAESYKAQGKTISEKALKAIENAKADVAKYKGQVNKEIATGKYYSAKNNATLKYYQAKQAVQNNGGIIKTMGKGVSTAKTAIKNNPYTLAGTTTLLDPEEANMQYGINGYYV